MPLTLARGETVLYPMPYVEAERPPYIVTNQRVIEQGEHGERVLAVKQIVQSARAKTRPYAAAGALLICLGLLSAGIGAYVYFSVYGMDAASYQVLLPASKEDPDASDMDPEPEQKPIAKVELPDDPSQGDEEHPNDAAWQVTVLKTRIAGGGLGLLGLILGMIGLRVVKKLRYFVVCRTQSAFMRVRVNDKVQQDIILATLQAVQ